VREPDESGWDDDGFDGGANRHRHGSEAASGTPGDRSAGGTKWASGADRSIGAFRPGLEALRLAIHRPDDVGHHLEAVLFRDQLQRAAFQSLIDATDLHEAIDTAPPDVRALLVRLTVEEPTGDADDVVLQLVRDAARGELHLITGESRTSGTAAEEAAASAAWVQELDDPDASVAASARLVAWLIVREQTRNSGQGT
jgi:hypothetical protein